MKRKGGRRARKQKKGCMVTALEPRHGRDKSHRMLRRRASGMLEELAMTIHIPNRNRLKVRLRENKSQPSKEKKLKREGGTTAARQRRGEVVEEKLKDLGAIMS